MIAGVTELYAAQKYRLHSCVPRVHTPEDMAFMKHPLESTSQTWWASCSHFMHARRLVTTVTSDYDEVTWTAHLDYQGITCRDSRLQQRVISNRQARGQGLQRSHVFRD